MPTITIINFGFLAVYGKGALPANVIDGPLLLTGRYGFMLDL